MFTSTWGVGHVFPMVPLARAFLAAGHAVRWVASGPACALVTAAGIDAVPGGFDADEAAQARRRVAAEAVGIPGRGRAAFVFPTMFAGWATPPMARDLLVQARAWRPDLLVREPAEFAAPLVGTILGIRCVTHSWGGATPAEFLSAAGERVAGLWSEHGLEIPPFAGVGRLTYLDLCPASVQPVPVDHLPDRLAMRPVPYTGERSGPLPDHLDDDPRPLVYLTLGTVQNRAPVLPDALRAVTASGARVLVAVGPDGDPAALGPQPDHVRVERWVCQSDVLPRAAAVVSHGGSGTFLGALGVGLPQVCLPQAADQFRNADVGARKGASLTLEPVDATAEAIEAAVRRVLSEASFRLAAQQVADEIRAMPSPSDVVTRLSTPSIR